MSGRAEARLGWLADVLSGVFEDVTAGQFIYAAEAWDRYIEGLEEVETELQEESMLEKKTTEREIEVELSDAERELRQHQFNEAWEQEQKVKAEKAVSMSTFNQELKEVRALQKACHDAFTSGKEKKKIEVYERRDERRGAIEIIDARTNELLDERPMTGPEREMKLFSEDGKQALVKANGKGKAQKNGSSTELAKDPLTAKVGEVAAGKAKNKPKRGKAKERVVELVGEGVADGRQDGELVDADYDPVDQLDQEAGEPLELEPVGEDDPVAITPKPKRATAKRSKPAAKAAKAKRSRKAAPAAEAQL